LKHKFKNRELQINFFEIYIKKNNDLQKHQSTKVMHKTKPQDLKLDYKFKNQWNL
jgi:hypothetical protein